MQESEAYFDPFEDKIGIILNPKVFLSSLREQKKETALTYSAADDETLLKAIKEHDVDKAFFCLENNVKPNHLSQAILQQSPELVALLLAFGATDKEPKLLSAALKVNSIALTKYFLQKNKNAVNIPSCGATPLVIATRKRRHIELMRLLIANGADVNQESVIKKGTPNPNNPSLFLQEDLIYTPLSIAITENDTEKVELLINNGAHCNKQFFVALESKETNIYKEYNFLEQACDQNNTDMVALLIVKGANKDSITVSNRHNAAIVSMIYDPNTAHKYYAQYLQKKEAAKREYIFNHLLKQPPQKVASYLITLTGFEAASQTKTLTDILPFMSGKDRLRFFVVFNNMLTKQEKKACEAAIARLRGIEPPVSVQTGKQINNAARHQQFAHHQRVD